MLDGANAFRKATAAGRSAGHDLSFSQARGLPRTLNTPPPRGTTFEISSASIKSDSPRRTALRALTNNSSSPGPSTPCSRHASKIFWKASDRSAPPLTEKSSAQRLLQSTTTASGRLCLRAQTR